MVLIFAIIFILFALPFFAKADKETTPLVFAYERQLSQPYIVHKPYASEFKPKTNGTIRKAETQTKRVSKPKTVQKKAAEPQSTSVHSGQFYSKEQVKELIRKYAQYFGVKVETSLCIAEKESGFNHLSANKHSTARGVFQYLAGTWKATDEGKAGLSVFDAEANVKAAIKYMSVHKSTKPWVVGTSCPKL